MARHLIQVRSGLVRWGSESGRILASRGGRVVIVLLALILTGVMVYQTVWLPLHRAATLPNGVAPTNPELVVDVLKAINTQRVQRGQAVRPNFGRYYGLFVPPPSLSSSN